MYPRILQLIEMSNLIYLSIGAPHCTADFVEKAIGAGADGFRLIAKGISPEQISDIYNMVCSKVADPHNVLIDLPGNKPRLGPRVDIRLSPQQVVSFMLDSGNLNKKGSIETQNLKIYAKSIKPGDRLLINDGSYIFQVLEVKAGLIEAQLLNNDPITLTPNRSINLPDSGIEYRPLSESDEKLLRLLGHSPNLSVAISMISSVEDILMVRKIVPNTRLVPKIETKRALENINSILKLTDSHSGIMLARGDLSIEMSPLEVMRATVQVTEKCQRLFLATWILESLIYRKLPSPDSLTDIMYFYEKGCKDFIISGEPAASRPFESIRWLRSILNELAS